MSAPLASAPPASPAEHARRLAECFAARPGFLIAYSGGVDSATLAYAAHLALGERMLAVLADSPALARRELKAAQEFARRHAIPLRVVATDELTREEYARNTGDRCYFCKQTLFDTLAKVRALLAREPHDAGWPVAYGVNRDDLGDYRPGLKAAAAAGAEAPFLAAGMGKAEVRALARHWGLEVADKPAAPCLSSRIPHGERVTGAKLAQVERAEDLLHDLGFRVLRVRHHGAVARIEVPPAEFTRLIEHSEQVVRGLKTLGFLHVSLDLAGFRSGSLNAALGL